jgi:uncharacterized membrane protein YqaE (UPF0057 family)
MKKILYKTIMVLLCISTITGPAMAAAVVPSTATSNPVTTTDPVPAASLKAALSEFKNLSRSERKLRIKEAKKELKAIKSQQKNGAEPSTNTTLLVILAILLPPLAVYLHQGEINNKFWISLLLTLLFFIPGVIYALLVVLGEA